MADVDEEKKELQSLAAFEFKGSSNNIEGRRWPYAEGEKLVFVSVEADGRNRN